MPRFMTISVAILLFFTLLTYVGLIATASTMHNSDAAGNGLSQSFAFLMTITLWILLAVLMLVAGIKGEMPKWTAVAAFSLVPASGVAAFAAVGLLTDTFYKAK